MRALDNSYIAIIPARGGSKRLPGKNLLPLAGKPLIWHTIEAAQGCRFVRDVYVSTEDERIAESASTAGAKIIERPKELASDSASSRDVALHALEALERKGHGTEHFALLQATSPLRNSAHLTDCVAAFHGARHGCAISVCEAEHNPSKMLVLDAQGMLMPFARVDELEKPQQSLTKVFRQNGAIYLMGTRDFRERAQGFFLAPAMPFVMNPEDSVDIDTALDLELAKLLMEPRR